MLVDLDLGQSLLLPRYDSFMDRYYQHVAVIISPETDICEPFMSRIRELESRVSLQGSIQR